MVQNKSLVFNSVPEGYPEPGKDLVVRETELDLDLDSTVPQGGVITKNLYISFDPYQRGRMRGVSGKSYTPPYPLGSVVTNNGVGRVVRSRHPGLSEGQLVVGHLGTETYSVLSHSQLLAHKVIEEPGDLPLSNFTSALGMPGLTAYASYYKIGRPKAGETIFISAASGAVGQIVGQLAKRDGLTVIGSVGSDEKAKFVRKTLKFDHAFNYKTETNDHALKRLAPQGIDIYFDNVGGEALEAALEAANLHARFIECGMISVYNLKPEDKPYLPKNLSAIVTKRLLLQGFICSDPDFGPAYYQEHQKKVSEWLSAGELVVRETVTEGIDNAAQGFVDMLSGKNFGKAVLKVD